MKMHYLVSSILFVSVVSLFACQSKSVNETASAECTPESEDVAMMMGGMGMGTQGTMGGMGMGGMMGTQGTQGTMGGMGMGGMMGMGMTGSASAEGSIDSEPAAATNTDESVAVAQAPCK